MASLQDQFLKAGLISQKKVKQVHQEKSKQIKENRRAGVETVDEAKLAAQELQRQQAERARELNAQRDAAARQKAIQAQIVQMVQQSRQSKGNGDIAYHFTHDNKIKRVYVSAAVQDDLVAGRLMIVCQGEAIDLVPRVIGNKIAERNADMVVMPSKPTTAIDDADDPYADYKIPDDLMW